MTVARSAMRRVGRYARKMPGFRFARRQVLPRVRGSATARSLAKRVFDIDAAQVAPMDISPGNLLGGVGTERLPVVVVVLIGVPAERMRAVVDEIAQVQLLTAGFRPVIVMDLPELSAARRYGFPVELLVDEDSWIGEEPSWSEYVRSRLGSIVTTYRSAATVLAHPAGLTRADRLLLNGMSAVREET